MISRCRRSVGPVDLEVPEASVVQAVLDKVRLEVRGKLARKDNKVDLEARAARGALDRADLVRGDNVALEVLVDVVLHRSL